MLLTGTVRCLRASDIFSWEKVSSRAKEPLGTCSYRRVTLSPSYTKWFSSSINLVVWPVQREDGPMESFRKKKIQRSRNKLLESNTLISIFSADLSKVYHKLLKLMHAISTLLRCKRIFERSILIVASRISNSLSKNQNLAHAQKRDCVP